MTARLLRVLGSLCYRLANRIEPDAVCLVLDRLYVRRKREDLAAGVIRDAQDRHLRSVK